MSELSKRDQSNSGVMAKSDELRAALDRLIAALDEQRFPNGSDYDRCGYSPNVTSAITSARGLLARGIKPLAQPPDPKDVAPRKRLGRRS